MGLCRCNVRASGASCPHRCSYFHASLTCVIGVPGSRPHNRRNQVAKPNSIRQECCPSRCYLGHWAIEVGGARLSCGGSREERMRAASVVENGRWVRRELTPTVREPLGYMAPETTFHHASVLPVTSSLWETDGGSPATLRRSLSRPPKGQKSRGPAWKWYAMAITKSCIAAIHGCFCSIQHFGILSKARVPGAGKRC